MKRIKRYLLAVAVFFAAFTLIGFFILPPILKAVPTSKLSEALHREVTINQIRVNPYALSLTVRGFQVKERGTPGTFVSLEEMYVNLQVLSVFKRALILREVLLKQPYVNVVRGPDNTYNFSDLMEKKDKTGTEEKAKPFHFSLNNIRVENGSIDFFDGPEETKHTVRELNIAVPTLSNMPYLIQTFVEPMLSANINGTPYRLDGQTKIFADSRETHVDIAFTDLDIPHYLAYVPMKLAFKIPSALMDAKTKISFVRIKDRPLSLTVNGQIDLKKVAIDDEKGNPVLRLPLLGIGIAESEPLKKVFHLSKVLVQSLEVDVRRERSGSLNVISLLPRDTEGRLYRAKEREEMPPVFDIDEVQLSEGKITFSDMSTSQPFKTTLKPIDLKISPFSTRKDKKTGFALSLKTEANETVKVDGELFLDPFKGGGTVATDAIPLKKYSPYYRDQILFNVEDGRLNVGTRFQYAKGEKEMEVTLSDLAMTLNSLRLRRPDEKEDFFGVPLVSVKGTQVDLTRKEIKVAEFLTQKGTLSLTRLQDGVIDLQRLLPAPPAKEQLPTQDKQPSPTKQWVITLVRGLLDQYTVLMNDQKPSQPVTLLGEKIRVTAENLSTAPNTSGRVSLSLLLDKKTTLGVKGSLGLDPLRMQGNLEVKQVALKDYSPYYRDSILFGVEDGTLGLSTNYQFRQAAREPEIRLSGLSLNLEGLKLKKKEEKENFADVPSLSVRNTSLDLNKKEVSIGEFSTQKGSLVVRRFKDGKLSVQTLVPEPAPGKSESSPAQTTSSESSPSINAAVPERPWLVKVGTASLDQYAVRMEDETPVEPVTLTADQIGLKAENLSTEKGQKGNVSLTLRLNEKGTLTASGPFGIQPLFADLRTDLKGITFSPFQPYLAQNVKIIVADGSLTTAGQLTLSDQDGKGLQLIFKGNSSVNNFASIDKLNSEDLLKWESLSLSGIDVGTNPLYVHVDGVALTNFYARLILHPDGSLNLQGVFAKEGEQKKGTTAASQAEKKEPPPPKSQDAGTDIKIEQITFQGGQINFTDHYVKPNYRANMVQLGGRISGLTSEETKAGEVELRGQLGMGAPLEIIGKINPLKKDLFLDLNVKFKDIELGPLTPYAGKYVGYVIEKGKLTMDLKYLVDHRKLDAQNKIFFDQLTFGDKVDSPTATKLPVKLAVSLLKDRNGMIRLDIPVRGSLDDPKFSVFRIVLQIIMNLLVKAATSPFALIGAVFGGGEKLEYMEFDYGSSDITGPNVSKVNTLVKVLQDRPALKIDITAYVDVEKDKEALRQLFFNRKLKAQKLKEVAKKDQAPVSVDDVKIDAAEYPKYLKMAYKAEKFPKPKTFLGFDKDIPVPEMEKLMLTHIEIKDDNLKNLAARRAAGVQEALVKTGKMDSERAFLVQAKSLTPEKKEKVKESRAEFKLK